MSRAPFAAKQPDLDGARVLVIGLGRSGRAAARLAASRGARVTAADRRSEHELADAVRELGPCGVALALDGHPAELAAGADLVVLSPGVPGDVPVIAEARTRGVPVWAEVELAWRFASGRVIGITGSNGKSTTTAMVGAILRYAGIAGGTGGNLATPFCELLELDGPHAVHAVELSSFQLESIDAFRADVGAILNLTPDHLDRYPDFDAYGAAKARLLETQGTGDSAILNADDPESVRFVSAVRGTPHAFSIRSEVDRGAFLDGSGLVVRTAAGSELVLDRAELPVPGDHNVANALAAALCCRLAGCPVQAIAAALRRYRPLPHRLERVGELRGVAFFNDSKATNLDAAERAVRSFPGVGVHMILGGKDKGADWDAFAAVARGRVAKAYVIGAAAQRIRTALAGAVPVESCETIANAVPTAFASARPGDVVLLAPGCASFDQYANFEARGDDFRRVVGALVAAEEASHA